MKKIRLIDSWFLHILDILYLKQVWVQSFCYCFVLHILWQIVVSNFFVSGAQYFKSSGEVLSMSWVFSVLRAWIVFLISCNNNASPSFLFSCVVIIVMLLLGFTWQLYKSFNTISTFLWQLMFRLVKIHVYLLWRRVRASLTTERVPRVVDGRVASRFRH